MRGGVHRSGRGVTAIVERSCETSDATKVQRVRTDSVGRFSLPGESAWKLVPIFGVASYRQQVKIVVGSAAFKGWDIVKVGNDRDSELGGHEIALSCDLDRPVQDKTYAYYHYEASYSGVCEVLY